LANPFSNSELADFKPCTNLGLLTRPLLEDLSLLTPPRIYLGDANDQE